MADLPLLKAGPAVHLRQEAVEVPALGGSVVVRGLLASECFAITSLRDQALRRVHLARQEHRDRIAALPPDATPPDFEPPTLDFSELSQYGRYITQMLAVAVTAENGLGLYTQDQWEVLGQTHPGVIAQLQAVAERLSGLNEEEVRKN